MEKYPRALLISYNILFINPYPANVENGVSS
jgi:hypothetical protein